MTFLTDKEFFLLPELRNSSEKIRGFVFGKFVKTSRELDTRYGFSKLLEK